MVRKFKDNTEFKKKILANGLILFIYNFIVPHFNDN